LPENKKIWYNNKVRSNEFIHILNKIKAIIPERTKNISGITKTGKSLVMAALFESGKNHLILTSKQEKAENVYHDLKDIFGEENILLLPSLETLLYEEVAIDPNIISDRLTTLSRVATEIGVIVVATADAVLHKTLPKEVFLSSVFTVNRGEDAAPDKFLKRAVSLGYKRVDTVTAPLEIALRGGIIDIYPSTDIFPYRIEFFGDFVEDIRTFDVESQRKIQSKDAVTIYPAHEILATDKVLTGTAVKEIESILQDNLRFFEDIENDGELTSAERLNEKTREEMAALEEGMYFNGAEYYLPIIYKGASSALGYFDRDNTKIIVDDIDFIKEANEVLGSSIDLLLNSRVSRGSKLRLNEEYAMYECWDGFFDDLEQYNPVYLSLLPKGDTKEILEIDEQLPVGYHINEEKLFNELRFMLSDGWDVVITTHQEKRFSEMLLENRLSGVQLFRADFSGGVIFPKIKVAVITDNELFNWQDRKRGIKKTHHYGERITRIDELEIGDFVVHINHGIGQYQGMVIQNVLGVEREFFQLNYANQDKIYVPADQLDRIQKYMSVSDDPPQVTKLYTGDWERIKKRSKKSAEDLAKQLLILQAKRESERGFAFSPDTPWQSEMEEGFMYELTPDQARSIVEVKGDMENDRPMERLLCGDVGYGKTEVAIRAAFKAVMDNKQVAIICPTTVLAVQHFRTFSERTAAYPIKVELICRSVKKANQKEVVQEFEKGNVDILIGTHRLFSKDIIPKDLGLVIIDEEQRFGVKQKDKLKSLSPNVDILYMSATPIPRTIHMAMSGLKELSTINTPPIGRLPVRTIALEKDDEILREAILRELDRDGQLFFLHNAISSIYHVAEHIRSIVPTARVEVAHGQMDSHELEEVMYDFYQNKFDVLVSTSIIENGLDLPNVNTIIVDNADRFGLAQLYQLRGRVGRSDRQAYAYLTWNSANRLTENANQRIGALKEFSSLGSGYKVALKDLEIRGAGNLLGAEQSGVMESVGYDMYMKMLEDAVNIIRGKPVLPHVLEMKIDLQINAFISKNYIKNDKARTEIYRRMASLRSEDEIKDMRFELKDRFGEIPAEVENLFKIISLKIIATASGIYHIFTENDSVSLRIHPSVSLSPQAVKKLNFEAKNWRGRGLPAPAYTPEKVTLYATNLEMDVILSMIYEVISRLTSVEDEISSVLGVS